MLFFPESKGYELIKIKTLGSVNSTNTTHERVFCIWAPAVSGLQPRSGVMEMVNMTPSLKFRAYFWKKNCLSIPKFLAKDQR